MIVLYIKKLYIRTCMTNNELILTLVKVGKLSVNKALNLILSDDIDISKSMTIERDLFDSEKIAIDIIYGISDSVTSQNFDISKVAKHYKIFYNKEDDNYYSVESKIIDDVASLIQNCIDLIKKGVMSDTVHGSPINCRYEVNLEENIIEITIIFLNQVATGIYNLEFLNK